MLDQSILLAFLVELFDSLFDGHFLFVRLVVLLRCGEVVDKSLLVRSQKCFLDGVDVCHALHDVDHVGSGLLGLIHLFIELLPLSDFLILEAARHAFLHQPEFDQLSKSKEALPLPISVFVALLGLNLVHAPRFLLVQHTKVEELLLHLDPVVPRVAEKNHEPYDFRDTTDACEHVHDFGVLSGENKLVV